MPYTPARSSDTTGNAVSLANGEFMFRTRNGANYQEAEYSFSHQLQLRTMQRGALQGQRVLFRKQHDVWEPFATLQADGTVWIWARHADMRDTAFHRCLSAAFLLSTQLNGDNVGTSDDSEGHRWWWSLVRENAFCLEHSVPHCGICSPTGNNPRVQRPTVQRPAQRRSALQVDLARTMAPSRQVEELAEISDDENDDGEPVRRGSTSEALSAMRERLDAEQRRQWQRREPVRRVAGRARDRSSTIGDDDSVRRAQTSDITPGMVK